MALDYTSYLQKLETLTDGTLAVFLCLWLNNVCTDHIVERTSTFELGTLVLSLTVMYLES